jgi:fermentation-respiration switch protein FrsA (DUF1100 family)
MAVETQRAQTGTLADSRAAQPLLRYLFWATAATLGVSGAAAAIVSGLSAFLVYQYARARGTWGTDEPPAGAAEEVTFTSIDNVRISGWFFPSPDPHPAPAVVLCHGVWTGRRECLPIALRLHAAGYNVLCFDFRAHGLSAGRFTSVGHHETNDVIGAVHYLKRRPEVDPTRIGVVGFSMGGAAAIQAAARCSDISALVADSAYASFLDAVRYSFHIVGKLPHYPFAPLAMQWAKWIVNVDASQLRPVDVIGHIGPRPVLILHGTLDEIVPVAHAHMLFKAAEEPKELWVTPGAHHVEARDLQPEEHFLRIETFLRGALRSRAEPSRAPVLHPNAAAAPGDSAAP